MPVISAPDIVVGIAATSAPLTAATAFATSITRPPPSATSRPAPRAGSSTAAAASGTPPGGTSWTASAASARPGAELRPRGVVSSAKEPKPCSASSGAAAPSAPSRKTTVRPASRQTKSPWGNYALAAVRGLAIGRSFGSTSSRRCS